MWEKRKATNRFVDLLYTLEVIISTQPEFVYYGDKEKKSFSHIALVVKFLDDNKLKPSLKKSEFALFQTSSILCSFI